ncbi:MAG TPA: hypothetical protein VGP08_18070 [Pyrinomonadaceae bacterium]|jgi:hypothetical protein|nr:hypothetical protein [Pyrinomonadaceae bacterium]
MRRNFLAAALVLAALPAASLAQTGAGARASGDNSTSVNSQALDIASGTRLAAELQGALDVSKARVGDRVLLKTTEAVKSGGRTVLKKGSTLVGHVSDVRRRARGSAVSSLTVIFDRLESGSLSTPVSATIDSITRASARARANDDEVGADARTSSSARTSGGSSSSGSSGGLLGGVTGAVGNTVGGVTGAAGDVLGSTTDAVGGVARGAGDTLGRVQITQSASLSADAGTTLSLAGDNLRLEKGTTFRLTLNESARVGNQ